VFVHDGSQDLKTASPGKLLLSLAELLFTDE
jgi:hypothetical protein